MARTPKADKRHDAIPPMMEFGAADEDDFSEYALPTEEQRRAKMHAVRVRELRDAHWHVRICPRGHVTETHRTTDNDARYLPCVICGQPAVMEPPDTTASREQDIFFAPLAVLNRASDALQDWAQEHLDAQSWTRRAEAARERLQKSGGDLFAHWRPRSQR
jgi:hypothetical protein